MSGASVAVESVRKSFDGGRVTALDGVTFRLAPGEFVALTGPSGGGKSTLLNLIGALDRPDSGAIEVDGRSLGSLHDGAEYRATTIGFVFQSYDLIPTLSAAENVQVPMIGRGRRRGERRERAEELLREVGLGHRIDAYPATLSGGERQRVGIARALANDPRLLLADEPTGALDDETANGVLEVLEGVRSRRGTTILLVTNDEEVAQRADRLLRLRGGLIRDEARRPAEG